MRAARLTALLAALAAATVATAEVAPRRGPRAVRDTFLLAQGRLGLAPELPELLPRGRSSLRVGIDWGNDFARDQDGVGENPRERRFLVDGEHASLDVDWRLGLGRRLEAGLRVPLHWRGGGRLDPVIDGFHTLTRALGLPDNDRSRFRQGLFRVEAQADSGEPLRLEGKGVGLGNVELGARAALARRLCLIGRAALPTGSGPFDSDGVGLGLQLVAAAAAGPWLFTVGAGASYESDDEVQGFRYSRGRAHGFAAADWRLARRFSAIVETTVASRLLTNVERYPGLVWYLALGGRLDLDSGVSIEAGFTENIAHQQATSDIAFQLALVRR